jgi:hypothetical protein
MDALLLLLLLLVVVSFVTSHVRSSGQAAVVGRFHFAKDSLIPTILSSEQVNKCQSDRKHYIYCI